MGDSNQTAGNPMPRRAIYGDGDDDGMGTGERRLVADPLAPPRGVDVQSTPVDQWALKTIVDQHQRGMDRMVDGMGRIADSVERMATGVINRVEQSERTTAEMFIRTAKDMQKSDEERHKIADQVVTNLRDEMAGIQDQLGGWPRRFSKWLDCHPGASQAVVTVVSVVAVLAVLGLVAVLIWGNPTWKP